MSRMGEVAPVLIPRDKKRSVEVSTWKIQNTLTRSEPMKKCRSVGVLPGRRGTFFNSTSLDCLLGQETEGLLYHHRKVVVN